MEGEILAIALATVALVFLAHLFFVHKMAVMVRDGIGDTLDQMSKLAQIGFIHSAAKTPEQAVNATVVLENEMAALEKSKEEKEPEKPKGKLVGFRGPNGRIVKFMTAPDSVVLSRIPEDRLVYQ